MEGVTRQQRIVQSECDQLEAFRGIHSWTSAESFTCAVFAVYATWEQLFECLFDSRTRSGCEVSQEATAGLKGAEMIITKEKRHKLCPNLRE